MVSKRVVLHFPDRMVDQPIIYLLTKEYNLIFNILLAKIMPDKEGVMVIELRGEDDNYEKGIEYLQDHGVVVQLLSRDVRRDDDLCMQCGACTGVCPTGALSIPDRETMIVEFDVEKCVACSLCVPVCPPKAMQVSLGGFEDPELEKLI